MKKLLLLFLVVGLIVSDSYGQKTVKKRKRVSSEKKVPAAVPIVVAEETKITSSSNNGNPNPIPSNNDQAVIAAAAAAEERIRLLAEQEAEANNEIIVDNPGVVAQFEEPLQDPCVDKRCGPGRECVSTQQGKAKCVCMSNCPVEEDARRRVCSNYNETWTSDCELYRSRCLCDENSEECLNPQNKHLHIEYYGECREMAACQAEEMSDFPRRMRDWLFNVMRELADRRELSPHYYKMEREAERATNESRRSVVAAVWKWCDLDGHPNDRQVSRHELFPIRAPLMALEHCIAPFLDNCDADNDHRITLKEWGTCLEVPQDEMLEKCDDVREGLENDEEGEEEV